jgi:hypothetical protein
MAKPDPLLDEIANLLAGPTVRDDPVKLERTLTDGYARALTLEAERSRIQKRIGQLAASAGQAGESPSEEVSVLVEQLAASDQDIGRLRTLLTRLRSRYSAARQANTA